MNTTRLKLLYLFVIAALVLGGLPVTRTAQTALAAPEAYLRIEGDPIDVEVENDGQMGVWFQGTSEYYGIHDKGSMLFIDGVGYDFGQGAAKPCTTPNQFTPVSHTQIDPWTIETVYNAGASARVTQRTEYVNGRGYYKITWRVLNTSGATLNNVKVLHGGDTTFQGDDAGRTNWDPTMRMVYIFNQGISGIMGLYGDPTTPVDHYFGGYYGCDGGNWAHMVSGSLPDTVDSDYLDAGYSVEWDRASLAPGAEWVVIGYEQFTEAGLVQVYAPVGQTGYPNQTLHYTFIVQNLQQTADTFDLEAGSSNGWTVGLPGGSTITLGSFETGEVQVDLTAGPTCPIVDTLALTVTSQSDPNVTNSAAVYTTIECAPGGAGIVIDPPPLEKTLPPDATDVITFTICNTGTAPLTYQFVEIPGGPARTLAAPAFPETVSITETFMNDTAPGWLILGDAYLTSGNVDPSGQGWLRLTEATNNRAGTAIYNTAFASTEGISVTFQYATYGGDGADGFTFYLIDGATVSPTVGAPGGSLGYSWRIEPPAGPGVTNGYVGIGFDEYGNFSNVGYGDCNPSCPGPSPDRVAIRGSGSLNTGFNFLINASAPIETGSRANAHTVNIEIVDQMITVRMDSGSGFVTYIDHYDLRTAPGQITPTPYTFKMGFSASTGGSTNYHEIRSLQVVGVKAGSTTDLVAAPNPANVGQTITFTATVTGDGGTPTGLVTFLEGDTVLGTGTLAGGVATFSTAALAAGTHIITARYEGDDNFGISLDDVTVEVLETTDIPWLSEEPISGTVLPGECQVVTLTFDSTGLTPGVYTGTLRIVSNDPDTPVINLPVTLIVQQPGAPALAIDKVAIDLNGGPLYTGDVIEYRVVVENVTTTVQTGVVITDAIPAHTTYVPGSAHVTQGSVSGPDPLVAEVGELAPGAYAVLTFRVTVDADAAGQMVGNTAHAASAEQPDPITVGPVYPEPDPGPVRQGPQALGIEKIAIDLNGYPLYTGDVIEYRIAVENLLDRAQDNVVITDALPDYTTYVPGSASVTQGTIVSTDPVVAEVGTLAAGAQVVLVFRVTVDEDAVGQTIVNQAQATSDDQQPPAVTPPIQPYPDPLYDFPEEPGGGRVFPTMYHWYLMLLYKGWPPSR